ncbi:hypothetical protein S40288_11464, partial [Stachybotrys chartarum IBT 40288]
MTVLEGEETKVSDPISDISSDVRNSAAAVDIWQPENEEDDNDDNNNDDDDEEAVVPQTPSCKRSHAPAAATTPGSSAKKAKTTIAAKDPLGYNVLLLLPYKNYLHLIIS